MSFGPRAGKYNAKPVRDGGRWYASTAEHDYHAELKLREEAGDVRDVQCQPVVRLANAVNYRPDFKFVDARTERVVYVEVKGFEGERWRVIQQLWRVHGPATLQVVKRSGRAFVVTKEILPHV